MFRMWYTPAKVIIKIPNSMIKSGLSFKKKNDKISKTDVELLRDDDLYAKVKEQQENSRKENKIRTGRILVAELRWDPYLYAWLEISRGFIVEKNWKEI